MCKLGIDDLTRLLQAAAGCIDQAQAAERHGDGVGQPSAPHVDQLEAAAAEIAGEPVRRVDSGHDAEGGELRLHRP
jgi:hypothetical protein